MDEDRQLALYQIGVQNMWNDVCKREWGQASQVHIFINSLN